MNDMKYLSVEYHDLGKATVREGAAGVDVAMVIHAPPYPRPKRRRPKLRHGQTGVK